jgi:hypothetical protein
MIPGYPMLIHPQRRMALQLSRASLAREIADVVPESWPVILADPYDRQFEGTGAWGFYANRRVFMIAFENPGKTSLQGVTRPDWVMDLNSFSALRRSGKPFCLVASKQAIDRIPPPRLSVPVYRDEKYGMWLIREGRETSIPPIRPTE